MHRVLKKHFLSDIRRWSREGEEGIHEQVKGVRFNL